ncbi:MAG: YceI family protein [Cyclobacteriaceae bacterium]|nr:YceI family protein [Cyclobacteriaceae bacterium]
MKKYIIIAVLLVLGKTGFSQTNWKLDKSHSNIKFTITHMVVSEVEGSFNDFTGSVVSESEDFNGAKVEFIAQAASVFTDNERRDNHLRSDDFFNAEKFPEVKFNGTIVKEGSKYYLVGKFTMRDVTKDVKFDVKYNGSINTGRGKVAGFKVSGMINRKEYGLQYNSTIESGGLVVSDEVEITCNVELREQK